MKKKNDRAASRPSINRDEDSRAGEEGLEEDLSAARSRQSNEPMEGSPERSRGSNVRSDDVRDPSSINRTTERHRSSESNQTFEGQSGQKSGSRKAESPRKNVSTREESEESEDSRDDVDRSLM